MKCPLTGCSIGRVIMLTIAAFLVIFAFDYLYHGIYMLPDYEITADLWRAQDAMQEFFPYALLAQFLTALAYGGLFGLLCKSAGGVSLGLGARYGILAGLIIGASSFSSYAYMPIPMMISLKWLAGSLLQGLLVGLTLALISRRKKDTNDS